MTLVALVTLLAPVPAVQANERDDKQFLAAREAFRAGDRARLELLGGQLQSHELAPYLQAWQLVSRFDEADQLSVAADVRAFLARHEGGFVAEKLRSDWLKSQGKKQRWDEVLAQAPLLLAPDQEAHCYTLQARQSQQAPAVLAEAMSLWLSLLEPPESCYPVLEALIWEKKVLADEVWLRLRRLIEANKLAAARYSSNYLPPSQTPTSATFTQAIEQPAAFLAKLPAGWQRSRMQHELVALAIARIARNEPRMAADRLQELAAHLPASARDWAWIQVGWQAAQRHIPEALDWYGQAASTAPMADEAAEWKVRAALRAHRWGSVRSSIEAMNATLASKPEWTYWLGRAYKAGGNLNEANRLFAKVAGQANFYGNLADDELEQPIKPPPAAAPVSAEELAATQRLPGITRALAWFRLEQRFEGTREWNWALRGMSDRQLLAAARIAEQQHLFDRAIAAADRTRDEHDYRLRYLAPYGDQVRPAARQQSLDDAWVYGLMRQESRFVSTAKSSAGASGLMQLMPATARWVAKKVGLKDYHHGKVNNTDVNLLLGTTYMRLVMEDLDQHPVLASAAYNAGPGRARRWRADEPLEGAIYAETIPFNETRDYVKKVMSNAVYYAAIFEDQPQSLKSRLGVVGAKVKDAPKRADLP